jgi:hypothetical protein
MQSICKLLGVKKIFTTAYHPQGNGGSEAINKPYTNAMSMYVSHNQQDWDVHLAYIQFAYNTSIHSVTKESPFFLTYGRDPIIPIEAELKPLLVDYKDVKDYRKVLAKGMREMYQQASYYSDKAHQAQERRAAEVNVPFEVAPGDLVYVYMPSLGKQKGLSEKLMHLWHGPFRVLEMTSPVNVRILGIQPKKKKPTSQIVHISRVKLYHEGRPANQLLPVLEDDDTQEPALTELAEQLTGNIIDDDVPQETVVTQQELVAKLPGSGNVRVREWEKVTESDNLPLAHLDDNIDNEHDVDTWKTRVRDHNDAVTRAQVKSASRELLTLPNTLPLDGINGNNEEEVDYVIGKKGKGTKSKYLVVLAGQSIEDACWISGSDPVMVTDKGVQEIREFERTEEVNIGRRGEPIAKNKH